MSYSRPTPEPQRGDAATAADDGTGVGGWRPEERPEPQEGDFWLRDEILVQPRLNRLVRSGQVVALRPRALRVLEVLAEHPGRVIPKDELLERVWVDVSVSEDTLYRTVSTLREALGDQLKEPRILATVHKVGYRLLGQVRFAEPPPKDDLLRQPGESADARAPGSARPFARTLPLMALALLLAPLPGGRHRSDHAGSGVSIESSRSGDPPPGTRPLAVGRPGLVGGISLVTAAQDRLEDLLADPTTTTTRWLALAEHLSRLGLPTDLERALGALEPRREEMASSLPTLARHHRVVAELRAWYGEMEDAEAAATIALTIERERADPDPLTLARSEAILGDVLAERKERRAIDLLEAALRRTRLATGNETGQTARAAYHLALGHWQVDDLLEAELYTRQARALAERVRDEDPLLLAECDDLLSAILWKLERWDEALEVARRAYRGVVEALGDDQSAVVARILSNLGAIYLQLKDDSSAQSFLHQAIAISDRVYRRENLQTAVTLQNLAIASWRQGDLERAEATQRRSVALRHRLVGDRDPFYASALQVLSLVLLDLGRLDEAERAARQSLDLRLETLGEESLATTLSLVALARVELATGRPEHASALLRRALEIRRQLLGEDAPMVTETRRLLLQAAERDASASGAQR